MEEYLAKAEAEEAAHARQLADREEQEYQDSLLRNADFGSWNHSVSGQETMKNPTMFSATCPFRSPTVNQREFNKRKNNNLPLATQAEAVLVKLNVDHQRY